MALLPLFGGVEVDEVEGDELLGAGALGGVIDDIGAGDVVVGDELVGAVAQDEVDAVRGLVGGRECGGVLGVAGDGREQGGEGDACEGSQDICAGAGPFVELVRLPHYRMLSMPV